MKEIKLNNEISINLPKLIDSRLLIQANSGAGKSWAIRRILEQSHGKVQQIVIDLEGEFSTLREKYEYVICGKGADAPATPQSAALLAKRLLEFKTSAIIDLYELPHQDRKRFVRLFLESMINAPKELWHPVMIVIDEAHVFVPEKGESEAAGAVIDLATRGRKRGFCAVLATQRISKLHKDAAAECNNKLIGRAAQDIDMKRSADELGFTSRDQMLSLRTLEAGEFYAFGTAISNQVIKLKIGEVKTSHPKAGSRSLTSTVPPTDRIKKILAKLSDLPAEARKEVETVQSLKQEIVELKRENRGQKAPILKGFDQKYVENAVKVAVLARDKKWEQHLDTLVLNVNQFVKTMSFLSKSSPKASKSFFSPSPADQLRPIQGGRNLLKNREMDNKANVTFPPTTFVSRVGQNTEGEEVRDNPIVGGALRMLKVLVSRYPIQLSRSQLATFSKLSPNSGTFGAYLSALRSKKYITTDGDLYSATSDGLDFIGEAPNPPQTTEEVIKMWKENLSGGSRRMFEVLVEQHPTAISREYLGQATDLSPLSGTFGTYLSILRSNGLIKTRDGMIELSDSLFI